MSGSCEPEPHITPMNDDDSDFDWNGKAVNLMLPSLEYGARLVSLRVSRGKLYVTTNVNGSDYADVTLELPPVKQFTLADLRREQAAPKP